MGRIVYRLFLVLVLALAFTAHNAWSCSETSVKRVIDGDTFLLNTGEKVRLLGVDTPELHHPKKPVQCFAQEAKDFVKAKIEGEGVILQYEGSEKDKYGRLLAWAFYWDEEHTLKLLNAEIIKQGYGFSYRKYPTSKLEEFNQLEKEARDNKRGLWADGACDEFKAVPTPVDKPASGKWCASKNSKVYHPCSCKNVKKINPENLIRFKTEKDAKASGRRLHRCR